MMFDGATIFRVHIRLREMFRRPSLFNDRMPAGRVRARIIRFRSWCGPCLWQVLCDCEMKRTQPRADVGKLRG